eukprot:CAMPEP_0201121306 /NCGR_PEP_ID=MMETSP0850-20130426/5205_1 /ASSEMBLY_ACC=CAM_ASM_000622 /TAXON_ID=183588 /ORGANISM="Pseudo-nitzschia fraudulenta, Strain WWA7" /LENGTH=603 /DNA_ID=CAMNT_0047387711 /DNA_START=35 /DNA_END=1844 /DNA_ORIENTATION=+
MENIFRSSQKHVSTIPGTITPIATPISMPSYTSKKQKRNHEEDKIKGRKSKTTPIKTRNCYYPGCRAGDILSLNGKSLEEQVVMTGVLQRLEEATKNAVEKYLSSSSIHNNSIKNTDRWQNEGSWRAMYRILSPSKRQRKQSRVRAVSTICAQISGWLSATVSTDNFPRERLVEHVVQVINKVKESFNIPGNNTPDGITTNDILSIVSIEAHLPSGQIICTIQIKEEQLKNHMNSLVEKSDTQNDTEMKDSCPREFEQVSKKITSDVTGNKLAKWYEKTTGKRLNLEPNQHCITIETVPAHKSALTPDVHRLYAHYQHVVHNDPNPFAHDPNFFREHIYYATAYVQPIQSKECRHAVLSNYYSFYQFLVEAPFPLHTVTKQQFDTPKNKIGSMRQQLERNKSQPPSSKQLPCGLYHQHYRIGGELLIAVGVIDILPTGLSSVYLFYHPSFSHELVALGKYAILKEVEFARDILQVPYYYLGYYIESCQKMRYKAEYKPTQILCPKFYDWVDATIAIAKLQLTPRHVCPLVEPPLDHDEENETISSTTQKSKISSKNNRMNKKEDIAEILNVLQMDIGVGIYVTIDMLHPSGVDVVKPILKEFI